MEQVAVFIDFENLVIGAEESLPGRTDPIPASTLESLCRDHGNAAVRRAYADWARPRFGRYQEKLALNGVDLIQVSRFGIQQKNAADIRMAVDAMETLITHPDIAGYVLVAGDGDYSPLVQRLREFGKWVVGVGTEATASRRLVAVCSEYRYWGTLVAAVDPSARTAVAAEFDIRTAEQLLVAALEQNTAERAVASWLKNKMLSLDPSFDERNYGCRSFREFLQHMSGLVRTTMTGDDLQVSLLHKKQTAGADPPRAEVAGAPAADALLATLRQRGMDMPTRPETRDSLLTSVFDAWKNGRLAHVGDIDDVLLDEETGQTPNAKSRTHLRLALVQPERGVIAVTEPPETDVRPLRQCPLARYDDSDSAEWVHRAHTAWLAHAMVKLRDQDNLPRTMIATFFPDADAYGHELVTRAAALVGVVDATAD